MSFSRCLQLRTLPCKRIQPSRLKSPAAFYLRTHQQTRVLQSSSRLHNLSATYIAAPQDFALPRQLRSPSRHRPAMATSTHARTTTQVRSHAGHSHHHHDNTYLVSKNKNDAGVRITRIGLFANLGMAIAKGLGGYYFNSQAMIADAWHSLSDLGSDILTLATVSWSLKPPTIMFPTGFGKVESLGSLGVSGMLLGGGIFMCFNSCEILYAHWVLDAHAAAEVAAHSHGHSHSHGAIAPSLNAAWLALGTVVIKEWLYQASKLGIKSWNSTSWSSTNAGRSAMKVAKERKSSVLASNAVHHRVDSLTGIVTLFAILGANFLHEASWLDPVGGFLISLLVIKAGFTNTVASVYELADKGIDDEVRSLVRRQAEKAFANLPRGSEVVLKEIQGVKSGQNYLIDLELAVPDTWTVVDTKEVEEPLRERIGAKVRGVRRIKMRFVPKDDSAPSLFDEFISGDVSPRSSPEPEPEDDHAHHDHSNGNGQTNGHSHANGNTKKHN